MAATERKMAHSRWSPAVLGILVALVGAPALRADRAADIRAQLSYIATALTSGNGNDAMRPFDKSFSNYDKLSNYFQGLSAFQLNSEVDVVDEQDADTYTNLTVDWTLTLTDPGTDATERRRGDINVRLVLKEGKWKIVDFSPISLFNPQHKLAPKR